MNNTDALAKRPFLLACISGNQEALTIFTNFVKLSYQK